MKQLFLIGCLLASFNSFCQEKFTGIGIFKIGSDTAIINRYSKQSNLEIGTINDPSEYYRLQGSIPGIYKIAWTAGNVRDKIASQCEDVATYFISEYDVSGIKLYNINLKFYKNKLAEVKCKYSDEVVQAMKQKYGKPKSELKSKVIYCTYKLTGVKEPHTEYNKWETWVNGLISAQAFVYTYYDTSCKGNILDGFSYEIKNASMSLCEKPKVEKSDKPKLTDF